MRGESPIASHLLYTQPCVLDDNNEAERELGIAAGLAWLTVAEASVVYTDLGISRGMSYGLSQAHAAGIPIEYRSLAQWRHAESVCSASAAVHPGPGRVSLHDGEAGEATADRDSVK